MLKSNLYLYYANFDHFIIMRDFNAELNKECMKPFHEFYNLKSLIKEIIYLRNPEHLPCIDLILTTTAYSFPNSCFKGTGLSNFHEIMATVLKTKLERFRPKIIHFHDYKTF